MPGYPFEPLYTKLLEVVRFRFELALNQERAEEEKLGGKPKRRKEPAKPVTAGSKLPPDKEQLDLF